ncbi:unnamed protein product [Arctogadus glacialis]
MAVKHEEPVNVWQTSEGLCMDGEEVSCLTRNSKSKRHPRLDGAAAEGPAALLYTAGPEAQQTADRPLPLHQESIAMSGLYSSCIEAGRRDTQGRVVQTPQWLPTPMPQRPPPEPEAPSAGL